MLIFTAQSQICFWVTDNLVHPKWLSWNSFLIIILCVLYCAQHPKQCSSQWQYPCGMQQQGHFDLWVLLVHVKAMSVHELTYSHFKRINLRDNTTHLIYFKHFRLPIKYVLPYTPNNDEHKY